MHWQRDPHGNHVARVTFKAGQAVERARASSSSSRSTSARSTRSTSSSTIARSSCRSRYPDGLAAELAPFLDTGDPAYRMGRRATELLDDAAVRAATRSTLLVELNAAVARADRVRDPRRGRRVDARGDARATGAAAAATRRCCSSRCCARAASRRASSSGYLVQLTDEGMIPDEPQGRRRATSSTCTRGPRRTCPAPAGSASTHERPARAARATSRSRATASPAHAAPLDGTSDVARDRGRVLDDDRAARPRGAADRAVHRRGVDRAARRGRSRRRRARPRPGSTVMDRRRADVQRARARQARAEWQGGALGADKWQRGRALADELRDRLAPGGVVLHRMGKHYPGESLPRWALDVIGAPRRRAAVARARSSLERGTIDAAQRVRRGARRARSASRPSCTPRTRIRGRSLRDEAQLPVDVDPRTAGLDDPEERRRLARDPRSRRRQRRSATCCRSARDARRLADRALAAPPRAPVPAPRRQPARPAPAARQPAPGAAPPVWADAPDLPDPRRDAPDEAPGRGATGARSRAPRAQATRGRDALGVRTALASSRATASCGCSCRRSPRFDDFCALVAAIDARAQRDRPRRSTSRATRRRRRRSCMRFAVTPDPGVLEVNLPPHGELRATRPSCTRPCSTPRSPPGSPPSATCSTAALAGSGGGNHITIGGPTPPSARRGSCGPTLLASLITFVQHHPSLSYMFTGLFVGPTSQAPRVDEARHDALYELELALPRLHDDRAPPRVAGRRAAPPPARRRRRLDPPRRDLDRQAVRSADAVRPPGPRRAARVRDAAASAHGRRAGDPRARAASPRSPREPYQHAARALGRRSSTTASCCRTGCGATSRTCSRYLAARGVALPADALPAVRRAALPARRHARGRRRARRGPQRDRAVARARRGGDADRHRALRRLVDGAHRAARASGSIAERYVVAVNGVDAAAARARRAATCASAACGSARGARRTRCTRTSASTTRCGSTSSTPGRSAASPAARTTCGIPRAARSMPRRSRASRPRRAARSASPSRARRRGRCARDARRAAPRAAVHARPAPARCRRADAARRGLGRRHDRDRDDLDASLAMHDELLARRGVEVWVGAEPTFTRADSIEPAWIGAAEGDDKLARAHALATALADALPGATRHARRRPPVPDEAAPRFAFGVRWRDGGTGDRRAGRASTRRAAAAADRARRRSLAHRHARSRRRRGQHGAVRDRARVRAQARAVWAAARRGRAVADAPPLQRRRRRLRRRRPDHARRRAARGEPVRALPARAAGADPLPQQPPVAVVLVRERVRRLGVAGPAPRRGHARALGRARRSRSAGSSSLADRGELPPEQLWQALGPLLVDCAGNSHRAELNVEKLWNPHIPAARRAPRQDGRRRAARGPHARAARRCSPRSRRCSARSSRGSSSRDYRAPLDRLARRAPRSVRAARRAVARSAHGARRSRRARARRPRRSSAASSRRGARPASRAGSATRRSTLRPALEFWPLVGDVASQERASARLVDASTQRWEISLDGAGPRSRRRSAAGGRTLRPVGDGVRAIGVRRRVYQPSPGLHPGLPATDPLVIEWAWAGRAQRIELWAWRPTGGPYAGLPRDATEALARRQERIQITTGAGDVTAPGHWPEARPFTIDLRADDRSRR